MKLLLDSHSFLWWLLDSPLLSQTAKAALANEENEVLASVVNIYELLFKASRGRLPATLTALEQAFEVSGLPVLPLSRLHAERAAKLDWTHGDPWDRILAAQAQIEGCRLLSKDEVFDAIAIERIW